MRGLGRFQSWGGRDSVKGESSESESLLSEEKEVRDDEFIRSMTAWRGGRCVVVIGDDPAGTKL